MAVNLQESRTTLWVMTYDIADRQIPLNPDTNDVNGKIGPIVFNIL